MRFRPTVIEVSLERRDSMRISRSRQASCAAWKRARAVCTASRRSSRSPSSAARRESRASSATRPRSSSARARASVSWPSPSFPRDFRGLFFEALAAHRGFLRPRTLAFELAEQVGVFAVRALDAALRLVAFAFRRRQFFAAGGETGFHVAGVLFAGRELDAQLLDALFALEHARVRIAAAVDAQPVAAYPLARARDDGFVAGSCAQPAGSSRAQASKKMAGANASLPAFRPAARATAAARWRWVR